MKESVVIAKEADTMSSPTKSDKSIHRARNEPERQLSSLRGVIDNIRRDGGAPSVESIATKLSSMPSTAQRAPVLLALQQTHGNRYVQRVVAGIQAKLKVGQPGDIYELEADRVADAVMRMPEPQVRRQSEDAEKLPRLNRTITPTRALTIQRQDDEEEEELKKKKKGEEEEETLQAKELLSHLPEVTSEFESHIHALKGGGQPLPESVRTFFEPRFGVDFGQVRVHSDAQAAESARAVNARAYTVGRDVVFGAGHYAPGMTMGKRLLAHELTHVVQQHGGAPRLQRAEVDTSIGCSNLSDTKGDVNKLINSALTKTRAGGAGRNADAQKVIDGLYKQLGVNVKMGRTAVEAWAEKLGSKKAYLPARSATKYAGVTYRLWHPIQPFPILNPNMLISNICVGSDKLGHFLQQGYEYYQIAHRQGKGQRGAEKYGMATEAGGFGLTTTGVFSNADLEANRQGLKFYEDLAKKSSLTFDISHYINENWSEVANPSYYEPSVGQIVWRNLLKGSWSGTFEAPSLKTPVAINVNFNLAGNVNVKGKYRYTNPSAGKISGIVKGKVSYLTNKLNLITGIRIGYEWQEGSAKGKGFWKSEGENKLKGRWGIGSSANNGGEWNLKK